MKNPLIFCRHQALMTNIFSNCLQIYQRENRMHKANLMRKYDGSQFSLDSLAILATMTHDQTVGLIHVVSHQLKSLMYNLFVLSRFLTTNKRNMNLNCVFMKCPGYLMLKYFFTTWQTVCLLSKEIGKCLLYFCIHFVLSRRMDKKLLYLKLNNFL